MATAAELLAANRTSTADKTLVIDNYLRTIRIPDSVTNLGVENDDDVLRLNFKMSRYLGDVDLSSFSVRINYLNANGESDVYDVDDLTSTDGYLTFTWLVGPTATKYKGNTKFNVCMRIVDADFYVQKEYNTTVATIPVLEGLECEESIVEYYSDILEQWKAQLFGIGDTEEAKLLAKSEEEQQNIVNKGAEVLASIPEDYATTYKLALEGARTKADAIVGSASGDIIGITDSSDDYVRSLRIYGKTTQIHTTGKNLWDNASASMPHTSVITRTDTGFTFVRGSNTGGFYVSFNIPLTVGQVVTFTCEGSTCDPNLIIYSDKIYGTQLISGARSIVYAATRDVPSAVFAIVINSTDIDCEFTNIQVELGSKATEYEPYSGGVISPSPEWPQAPSNIVDSMISVYGKNMFVLNGMTTDHNGVTYMINDDGTITASGTATDLSYADYTDTLPKGSYHFSGCPEGGNTVTGYFIRLLANGKTVYDDAGTGFDFTLEKEAQMIVRIVARSGTVLNDIVFSPMIRSTVIEDTSFERGYAKQSLSMHRILNGIPVTSGGNYIDDDGQRWICDEIDLVRGVVIQRVAVKRLDGSLSYQEAGTQIADSNTYTAFVSLDDIWNADTDPFIADRFKCYSGADYLTSPLEGIYTNPGTTHCNLVILRIDKSRLDTANGTVPPLTALGAFLHLNPVLVCAPLLEPKETELTDTNVVDALALTTFYPYTTIVNDAGVGMTVEYNIDTKTYIDNSIKASVTSIMEAIKNGSY